MGVFGSAPAPGAASGGSGSGRDKQVSGLKSGKAGGGYGSVEGMMNALAEANGGSWGGSRGSWGASGGMTPGRPENRQRFRGYTAGQVDGLMATGMGWVLGDEGAEWANRNIYGPRMANRRATNQNRAYMRAHAEDQARNAVGRRQDLNGVERANLYDAVASGDLSTLDENDIDTSRMRATHHGGGLLGSMAKGLGWDTDDVETIDEGRSIMEDAGYLGYNAATGQWETQPSILGPMAGIALNIGTGPIAKGVYAHTESVPAAKGAAKMAQSAANKLSDLGVGARVAKGAFGMLSGAPGPVGGALASGLSGVNNAARLSYLGVPSHNTGMKDLSDRSGNDKRPTTEWVNEPNQPAMQQQAPGWILPQWSWSQYA